MDTAVSGLPLTIQNMEQIIREIISINLGDQVTFHLVGISPIMDELEYEGLRVGIETHLDKMITHLKIDVSTGDAITPQAITYNYGFMFEDRTIQIKAYPIETVLAEKIETMISRADTNTRMRDFYDMHILLKTHYDEIDNDSLRNALNATSRQRGTTDSLSGAELVLKTLENSPRMAELWQKYQVFNSYAKGLTWDAVTLSVRELCLMSGLEVNKLSIRKALNMLTEESRRKEERHSNKETPERQSGKEH